MDVTSRWLILISAFEFIKHVLGTIYGTGDELKLWKMIFESLKILLPNGISVIPNFGYKNTAFKIVPHDRTVTVADRSIWHIYFTLR